VRRVRESLLKLGSKLASDDVYALELDNGARVLALPSSDDSIRGSRSTPGLSPMKRRV
jgi:hypothetical protein